MIFPQQPDGVRNQCRVTLREKAIGMEQRRDSASSVGSAAEAEQVDPIARLVMIHDEGVDVADVGLEAIAERHAGDPGQSPLSGADESRWGHRADPGVIIEKLAIILRGREGELKNVGSVLLEFIGGPVAADQKAAS